MGEKLGDVTFLNSNKNPKIVIKAINGKTYKGIYYKEDGDYARVKLSFAWNGHFS